MKQEIAAAQQYFDLAIQFLITYGFQVVSAIIILVVGLFGARWLSQIVTRLLEKQRLDVTLAHFLGNLTKVVVMGFVIIIAIGKFGISIAPFIAAVGALAFGSSLALQGPLSNYGAGLSIVLSRPFVVGDTITIQGVSGSVEEVRLAATYLVNEDGEKITIPNRQIVGEILVNSRERRMIETSIRVSYDDNPQQCLELIRSSLNDIPDVATDPAPLIGIHRFGRWAIVIGIRCWVPTARYFQTRYRINAAVFTALQSAGIMLPLPQREIRVREGLPLSQAWPDSAANKSVSNNRSARE